MRPNYDKRITEILNTIRAAALRVGDGNGRQIINQAGKLDVLLRRYMRRNGTTSLQEPVHRGQETLIRQDLLAGRVINCRMYDSNQFHSAISRVRQRLKKEGTVVGSRYIREDGVNFKEYYIDLPTI